MIKVNVIAVGKVKEKYFADGIAEYAKRLSRFCEFSIIECEEVNPKSAGEIPAAIEKEGEKILPRLKGYVIAAAVEGNKLSSEGLAKKIGALKDGGIGEITFVIGGSNGLSDKVKKRADFLLSASDMTFPHTLFRLMLTEQIYRAFTILSGTSYHK